MKQSVKCGKSASHPTRHQASPPKCTNECAIAKRNAKLAEALGIDPQERDKDKVMYNDEVTSFARANPRFLGVVEQVFADFVSSKKRIQVLPHTPPEKRKFVHDLASVYRIDTQLIDQEPQRSVQLIKRIDSRIPVPKLSTHLAAGATPAPNFGRLADLRSLKATSPGPSRTTGPSGWGASTPSSSRWGSGGSGTATPAKLPGHGAAVVGVLPPSVAAATTAGPSSSSSSSWRPSASAAPGSVPARVGGASAPRVRTNDDDLAAAIAASLQTAQAEGRGVEQEAVVDNWEDDL
jgi:transcriptional repressor NF-X1